jgi:ubiquinone/menaquinone biosynthesis C-methylase UbiE
MRKAGGSKVRTSKHVGYDEEMRSALELWLLMKLQAYLYRERLLVPVEVDLSKVWRILDVACGSGQWVRDMAMWSPEMTIVGLDRQVVVVEQARRLSQRWRLANTGFLVGDMHHMDAIGDESFDLMHARFLGPVVAPQQWPSLLQECLRVCHAGGTLVWTEAGFPTTNSAACRHWWQWMKQAITRLGYTPDVTPYMQRLLEDVGGVDRRHVRRVETALDLSADTPLHTQIYRHISSLLDATKPLLLKTGVADEQELEAVFQQMSIDVYSDPFQATWTLTTLLAEKA